MKNSRSQTITVGQAHERNGERGSATVIALLIMGLLTVFVSLALSRSSSEAMLMGNDAAEGRAFNAAQASLETMTRNFNKIYDIRLTPIPSDLTAIQAAGVPGFTNYGFNQIITATASPSQVVISGGAFQGLYATRDAWRLDTTATDTNTGVQVQLTREFYNNLVPIFQFGIFYDDNMEFHPGPKFAFGGRVHSNASIFLMANDELTFDSRVTAVGQIVTETARNGSPWTNWNENVFVKDASGLPVQLKHDMGSVRGGPDYVPSDPDMPDGTRNPAWASIRTLFDGNLEAEVKPLKLPIKGFGDEDYVELVRRGVDVGSLYRDPTTGVVGPVPIAAADNAVLSKERYANKTGIRVSLADSKAKLPGCASGVGTASIAGPCGVRLDGAKDKPAVNVAWGAADVDGSKGYQPVAMGAYIATRLNGNRLDQSNGRENWIKVELVSINTGTGLPQAQDVTEEFLALGVTEQPAKIVVAGNTKFEIDPLVYNHPALTGTDSRSVIKLQRFLIPGPDIKAGVASTYLSTYNWTTQFNLVVTNTGLVTPGPTVDAGFADSLVHKKKARVDSATLDKWVVPFPIEMFDTREGLYNDNLDIAATYPGGVVPRSGVLSVIDIDVANLRRVLSGAFDGSFPAATPFALAKGSAFRSTDVPSSNGWVLYVSDRRGDIDFDGEYDMEDIFGNNDGILQSGENVNYNKTAGGVPILDVDTTWQEAARYSETFAPDMAAVVDHKYYRRAVRLVNGSVLPGVLDLATPGNTLGFTVASENGVYIKGNYNATGVSEYGNPTSPKKYLPFDDPAQIPASVVGDAVMVLSNSWNDAQSFRYPFALGSRRASETTVRAAVLAGDAMSSLNGAPNQGGGDPRLNGGVHNFKRFVEDWGGVYLNYCGSLINLFNARNNNGAFKCCSKVYSPPIRNWIFDTSFLDPTRLPPGTPAFQFVQVTGFQRVNT